MKNCGIYKIINIENGKYYLGSSCNISKRFKRHIKELNEGKHHNIHLQRSFNKYGESKFELKTLTTCNKENLIKLEQKYLDKLKPWKNSIGFNISKQASGGDLISNHPNKALIIKKMKKTLNTKISKMTKEERQKIWGRTGSSNPNWKNGKTFFKCPGCGIEYRTCNKPSTCPGCRDRTGKNNPFFGKSHSKETKEKLREAMLGNKPTNTQRVKIENKIYPSMTEAASSIGVAVATISNRINSDKFPKYSKLL